MSGITAGLRRHSHHVLPPARSPALAALAAVALVLPAGLPAQVAPPEASLEAIRAATERFRDVDVALAEGYVPDPTGMCATAEMEGRPASDGAMGLHYFRPDRLGVTSVSPRLAGTGTHTDFLEPAILLYEPQEDGSLVLVGVENLVFQDAWRAAGHHAPPTFRGRTWDAWADDPTTPEDEAHGIEPHYDQHVWLFREHPTDALAPFNPAVTCEHARSGHATHAGGTPGR